MRKLILLTACSLWARDYGPAVGSRMPAFELPDQDSAQRNLGNVMGPKGALILFYRSADW
ncbi:MAG TPA: hypothetical protein VEU96_14850 [Bryobacteraceae bacterium]|nr:hypothetical protein [Bryobacteraceae bacterium]